ncbi:granzyme B-like [Copidosoma floridanum]|uniref:granzyme B-like n=1 Tax=Copidosoma floridanum TaxID=29053 RepID=UPI0006C98F37|nr:granzyme B-like [Copidosoma floridanum]
MRSSQGFDFRCGGVLIKDDYVLTRAACVVDGTKDDYQVVAGTISINPTTNNKNEQLRFISKILFHNHFNKKTYEHDVAILKLENKIKLSKVTQVIKLPKPHENPNKGNLDQFVVGYEYLYSYGLQYFEGHVTFYENKLKYYFNNRDKGAIMSADVCVEKSGDGYKLIGFSNVGEISLVSLDVDWINNNIVDNPSKANIQSYYQCFKSCYEEFVKTMTD